MEQEKETQGGTTESTERIPPGSMPPDDEQDEKTEDDAKADQDEKADRESKESFPASDPPSW